MDCADWWFGLRFVKMICEDDYTEILLKNENLFRKETGRNKPDAKHAIMRVGVYARKF
jgi:hypothetical protein